MPIADHVTQLQQELQTQYDQVTRLINELQKDLGRSLDGEQKLILQDRLREREQERERIAERQKFVEQHADDIRAGRLDLPGLPEIGPAPGESPYKGLQYFDEADADNFFGRETLTAELVDFLRHNSLLAVVGASGSGKSSLVRAGLTPALQRGQPTAGGTTIPKGSAHWSVHILTPTARPLESLAASLTRDSESVTATATLTDDLAKDPRSLHLYVRRRLSKPGAGERLLLVVDQFEEIFTLCRDKAQRKAFVDNLLTAACPEADGCSPADTSTLVVLTLRADFYAQCAEFENLRTALERYQRFIGAMSQEELRRAIEAPAKRGGWELEPGLMDVLLQDVGDEPGALPLLSHVLLETWQRRRGRTLTLAGYATAGRVQGAIAKTADALYQRDLTSEQQPIARSIFLRLTELGENAPDTRRRVALSELIPQNEQKASVELVLNLLVNARLVTTSQTEAEVAHEALIRQWPILQQWLDDNRDGLRVHRRLTEAAQEWEEDEQDVSYLYRGTQLAQARKLASQHADDLNPLEARFVTASVRRVRRDRLRQAALIAIPVLIVAALVSLLIPQTTVGWERLQSWDQTTAGIGRYGTFVAIDGAKPDVLYAADRSKGGVYISDDNGERWQNIAGDALADQVVRQMAVAANRTVYATTSGGLYRSDDQGKTWQILPVQPPAGESPDGQPQPLVALAIDPSDRQRLVIGRWHDAIYVTADGGQSWQLLVSLADLDDSQLVRALAIAPDGMYAATDQGLFRQSATDQEWKSIEPPFARMGSGAEILALTFDTKSEEVVAGTRGGGVWRLLKGDNWESASQVNDESGFAFSVSQVGDQLVVGTTDAGLLRPQRRYWWQALAEPVEVSSPATGPVDAPDGMVGVPKGEFEMGGVKEATLVYTDTYYIDELEVTLKDYCETLQPPERPPAGCKGVETKSDLPATTLSGKMAQAFCVAKGKHLLTEVEWEKAARGPDGRMYPWGNTLPLRRQANVNSGGIFFNPDGTPKAVETTLQQVGGRMGGQSPYGAQDMSGNAGELAVSNDNPTTVFARGGGFTTLFGEATTFRTNPYPELYPSPDIGFRCAKN